MPTDASQLTPFHGEASITEPPPPPYHTPTNDTFAVLLIMNQCKVTRGPADTVNFGKILHTRTDVLILRTNMTAAELMALATAKYMARFELEQQSYRLATREKPCPNSIPCDDHSLPALLLMLHDMMRHGRQVSLVLTSGTLPGRKEVFKGLTGRVVQWFAGRWK